MTWLLVLGVGNTLLGDDGFGPRAIEALEAAGDLPPGTRLLDGGTRGLLLLPEIEDAERLIVIDGVDLGWRPGEVRRLAEEEVPPGFGAAVSPHEVGLCDLMALCRLRGTTPHEVILWGVQVVRTDPGPGLSREVEAGRVTEVELKP